MEILSVNVGSVRTVRRNGKDVTTGIFKEPVEGRLAVRGVNLDGDDQADRNVHGGPDQVIYAYASEDYQWWQRELDRELLPGTFGENLTTRGIDLTTALVGERWRVGTSLLRITGPRIPCDKLAMRMGDPKFVKRFGQALRPGAYFALVEEGDLARGDAIDVVDRPAHDVTIGKMMQIYLFERFRRSELLVPDLPEDWRQWIQKGTA